MRCIAVVTTSRADYSHLYWVLRELGAHPEIDHRLIALGPHLSPEFGATVAEIESDGLTVDECLECLLSSDTDIGMAKTIGVATLGLADVLGRMRPDLLLLVADRYEMLAPATAALALRIPIAHIEGGEVSEGAIDHAVRNALTMMSHIHLTPTAASRRRVLAMGEEEWRVHQVGAPSLDHLSRSQLPSRQELEAQLDTSLATPPVVVAYHPVTLARDTTREADQLFAALDSLERPIVFAFPNSDAGSRELICRAERFCEVRAAARLYVNLGPAVYWGLLHHAAALVGNSSSGIMEAASLGLPVVNVGIRQQGRQRAANVVDVEASSEAILAATHRALEPEHRASLEGIENPYGDGQAAARIVEILASTPLGEQLLLKRAAYIDGSSV